MSTLITVFTLRHERKLDEQSMLYSRMAMIMRDTFDLKLLSVLT